jgi:hypothetical protein
MPNDASGKFPARQQQVHGKTEKGGPHTAL